MNSFEIKKKFIDFYLSKKHKEIPNVSLIPENDPTSLFIMAGMQPLVPYFLGEEHPQGKRLVNIQRSIRMDDLEEVGDNTHHTFFEMLGIWSLGNYFKEESIEMSMEYLVKSLGIDPKRLYATVFCGGKSIPADEESMDIWKKVYKKYGITAEVFDEKNNDNSNARIFPLGLKDNLWGPAGECGPCGPSSEIFYYRSNKTPNFSKARPGFNDDDYTEIWNNVFMEFEKSKDGSIRRLKHKNVDTGVGCERLTAVLQNIQDDGSLPYNISNYDTDLFDTPSAYLRSLIEDETKKSTEKENPDDVPEVDMTLTGKLSQSIRSFRIILDHMRACVFLLADGVEPSNKDQGYILRRLIRRTIRHAKLLGINENITKDMAQLYIEKYKVQYPHLQDNKEKIINILEREEINFEKTIARGVKELDILEGKGEDITGKELFYLFETYGFPIEIALDELGVKDSKTRKEYNKQFNREKEKHQKQSRKGAKGKFAGGLADTSIISKRYHTATHLLLNALQQVLGAHVHQRGSNITSERLRFDFSHPEKMTKEQIKEVEEIVNENIKKGLTVEKKIMPKEEALKLGAECEFPEKYPDKVTVYSAIDPSTKEVISSEFCGGPHVQKTSELALSGKFKIIKEESSSSGVRRIKAVLE